MTIQLDKERITASGLSLPEAVLLLFLNFEQSEPQALNNLLDRNLLKRTSIQEITKTGVKFRLTAEGENVLKSYFSDTESKHPEPEADRLSKLAKQLKEIFPKGRKDGTTQYWAEGNALIIRRLKLFFKKYGTDYTDEQIVSAARAYVNSFNGDYRFMRVLKYFILKEVKGANGEIEGTSDLINYIDHAGEENSIDNNWMDSVR